MKNPHRVRLPAVALGGAVLIGLAGLSPAQTPAPDAAPPPTRAEGSYLLGVQYGEQLVRAGVAPDLSSPDVVRGVTEGLAGRRLDAAEQTRARDFVRTTLASSLERNRTAAHEFLAQNAKQKGVKTTASGLQYRIVRPGDAKAAAPGPNDRVSVDYRGRLVDGAEFDSSYARGEPASFQVGGVIKGWQEALQLMKPGEKIELWVPPELGYDATPRPGIPAGSLLVYDVELHSVTSPPAAPRPPIALPLPKGAPATPPATDLSGNPSGGQ